MKKGLCVLIVLLFCLGNVSIAQPNASDFESFEEPVVKDKKEKKQKKNKKKKKKVDLSDFSLPVSPNETEKELASNPTATEEGVISLDIDDLFDASEDSAVNVIPQKILSFKDQETVNYFYGQAMQKISTKEYKKAVEFLNKSLKIDPKNKEMLQLRGNAFAELQKFKKSKKDFKQVLKIAPNDPIANYNMASVMSKRGKYKEAIEYYTNAIKNEPEYIMALQGRGTARSIIKEYELAIDDFNRVLDQNAYFIPAYKGRGIAKRFTGRYNEAISDFTQTIDLVPGDGFAYYYRGLTYAKLREIQLACKDFDKAYKLGVDQALEEMKTNCSYNAK